MMFHLTLLALLSNFAVGSITFVATSKTDLPLRPLPSELTVTDVESLVKRTALYSTLYNASRVRNEEMNGPVGSYPETEMKPDVFLVRGSPVASDGSIKSSPFGFVGAATTAYGYHSDLVIRPDDIWITILSQFSFYVNARAEELRYKFVKHEGKKKLTVTVVGYSVYNAPYDDMTRKFLDLISENIVDSSLREWFLPGFSTTTKTDEVVAAATAMCTFQEYFSYKYELICGIPHVTLEGTVDDWELLATKIERLLEFDDGSGVLFEWLDLLRVVMGNFVESAKDGSKHTLEFWDNILYYNSNGDGCGNGPPLLSGWITVFSFFDKDGQKMAKDPDTTLEIVYSQAPEGMTGPRRVFPTVDMDDMNANVLSCPATIDDNGVPYNATLFVGQMSFAYEPVSDSAQASALRSNHQGMMVVKPRNDWALVIEEGETELDRPSPGDRVPLPSFPLSDVEICYWYEHLELVPKDCPNVTVLPSHSLSADDNDTIPPSMPAKKEKKEAKKGKKEVKKAKKEEKKRKLESL